MPDGLPNNRHTASNEYSVKPFELTDHCCTPSIEESHHMALTKRQNKFLAEYAKDGNATQAAIRAGYSARSAYNQGHRLMKNDEVHRCLDVLFVRSLATLADTMQNAKNHRDRLEAVKMVVNLWESFGGA